MSVVTLWRMFGAILIAVVVGAGGLGTVAFAADELTIAAASDLNFAFKELIAAYERQTGRHVRLSLGSSGNFYSQIENGAPFDLYFSADIRYPQKLIEGGYAVPDSLYKYAVGRIVLWVPNGSPLPIERGLGVLTDGRVRKIAIANPKHAPYGRAAVAALESAKLKDAVNDRLVLGENISQAAQFIESGACDAGIIALSLALAPSMKAMGKYYEIPENMHPPLEQGAVVVKTSKNQDQANTFLDFMKGPEGRQIMQRYGFVLPS
jgi:molybdate transport system substrate-binding protein